MLQWAGIGWEQGLGTEGFHKIIDHIANNITRIMDLDNMLASKMDTT